MKKLLILVLFLALGAGCAHAYDYQIEAGAGTKRLVTGTKIPLKMAEPVTAKDFETGDMFSATVAQDVVLDHSVVLPVGTLVRGNVKAVDKAKRLSKAAKLYLSFDHIVTPQGRQLPINAALSSNFKLTLDGGITTGGNYGTAVAENWEETCNIVKNSTNWGITAGDKAFPGAKFILTPLAAAGGTVFGGGYFVVESVVDIFRKGNEVIINQGQVFGIMLLSPLDVPAN